MELFWGLERTGVHLSRQVSERIESLLIPLLPEVKDVSERVADRIAEELIIG